MRNISIMARLTEIYLRLSYKKQTDEEVDKSIRESLKFNPPQYTKSKLPRLSTNYLEENVKGYKVYHLRNGSQKKRMILYIHGGAYVGEITAVHWKAIDKLADICNAEVIVPIYGLAPHSTCIEAFEMIEYLYSEYREQNPETQIILMGDSAGGGLALAICEYFAQKSILQPDKLVLFSPWVDINLDNPLIKDYESKDVFLTPSLRVCGKWWAGDLSTRDYRVSPLFGDLSGIDNVTIFVGTNEILYPDILELYMKITRSGKNCKLIVGNEMGHVYPILPIPEGKKALLYCGEIINT